MDRRTVVIGLGNPLMSDEGIGVLLARRLSQLQDDYPCVDFVDAGTGGVSVLHLIADKDKAIFVDCARMGLPVGTIRRFTPDQVESTKPLGHHSLHEADLMQVIEMARRLGQCPRGIVIFGIEPASIEPGTDLSWPLAGQLDDYISTVLGELDAGSRCGSSRP